MFSQQDMLTVVIPAKAGIHFALAPSAQSSKVKMDPSFRWDDDIALGMTPSHFFVERSLS